MPNTNSTTFQNFFQQWLLRQEHYLHELRSTLTPSINPSRNEDYEDLINRVLAHYQEYYEQKSRIANHDVLLVFSPPWFSAFERSFFWIAGVKPGLAFSLVRSSVEDMSEEQVERMGRLKTGTRAEERELEEELARIQEGVAAVNVVKKVSVDEKMKKLKVEMEAVLTNADMLRTRTAERVVEILTAVQKLKFLTALTEFQMRIRMCTCR